eukprot:COSAG01_NODE_10510_length_2148_cov_771.686676_3_plen_86_part_00
MLELRDDGCSSAADSTVARQEEVDELHSVGEVCDLQLRVGDLFVNTEWVGADFVYTCTMMFSDEMMVRFSLFLPRMSLVALFRRR